MESKRKLNIRKISRLIAAGYILFALLFWLCAKEQLYSRVDSTDMLGANGIVGEITGETVFTQKFKAEYDGEILAVKLRMSTFGRENTANIAITLYDGETELSGAVKNASEVVSDNTNTFFFDNAPTLEKGHVYTISVTSEDGVIGNALTAFYGNNYMAGKGVVSANIPEEYQTHLNGQALGYALCWSLVTKTSLIWGSLYIYFALGGGILVVGYCMRMISCYKHRKSCIGLRIAGALSKYRYLIKQLVSRDFKTKYRRSVLGVLWSLLNPLMMMTVQYIVFSTLFKSDIPNYLLYLMSGIVCFNFFNECAGLCLSSITGNASLITKVYMPKYIYPVSRALSSGINLLFSLIPLFGVMLITQVGFSKAIFLLPIPLVFLFAFSLGMGMLLATMMVFFRDTQFLWGVLSMLWMYLTPVFYPDSILPAKFLWAFKLNPMYHIIRLVRVMLIDGASPEPKAYFVAAVMSFGTLIIGALIFRKQQDKFVLNL